MRRFIAITVLLLLAGFANGQTSKTPIYNGILQSDLDANGFSIVNLVGGGGGGNVSNSGTPTAGQKATWTDATHIQGVTDNALQWDGGATNLVAATARTSLALVPGTNVEVPLTFSTGLTRSTNTVTVNSSQNIATLSNLTTNGFVKTGGAVGTLSVDTATYQAASANLTTWAGITPYLGVLTITTGKTLNATNSLTFSGTDGSTLNVGTGGTLGTAAYTASTAYQAADADLTTWAGVTPTSGIQTWLATPNSANLRTALTDENGTGAALFSGATTPDFTTGFTIGAAAANNYELTGNGTNFAPKASDIPNGSSAQQTGFASNTYLAGSVITLNAGDFKVGSTYRCMFDMTKTTAGTAAPVVTIYIGTGGAITDTAAQTITFAAATGVADTGMFEIWVNFRAVGASATIASVGKCAHNLAATGLTSTGAAGVGVVSNSTSSTFNSTAATKIGCAFNGGASYVGTNNIVQAYYSNP